MRCHHILCILILSSGRPGVRGKHIHYSRRVFLLDLEKYVFEVNQVRIWANTYFREVHEF